MYDKDKILEEAKKIAKEEMLFEMSELVTFLPCSSSTFYEWFPANSEESETIKEIFAKNKVQLKTSMREKWYRSENPTLQVALYKLLGTEGEVHRLNGSKQEIQQKTITQPAIDPAKLTNEELTILYSLLAKGDTSGTP